MHFLSLWICLFWVSPIKGIIWPVFCCLWLSSFSIMFSKFIYVITCIRTSFLFEAEWYSTICMYLILFIYLSVDRHWDCFHLLTIVKNAAVNIGAQVSVWSPAFNSFGCIYLEAELWDHAVILCITFWGTAILFSTAAAWDILIC